MNLDKEVRAEDDFDSHVNNKWKNANEIPDKYPRFTNFTVLSEKMEAIMKDMVTNKENSLINNIFNLYLNQTDAQFKKHVLVEMSKITNTDNKQTLLENVLKEIPNGSYYLLHICFSATCRNPKFQIPNFNLSCISLPDKSYYIDKLDLRPDFEEMINNIFNELEIDNTHVKNIWDIEAFIAEKHYTKAEKRDPLKTYHPMTLKNFIGLTGDKFKILNDVLPNDIYDISANNDEIPTRIAECFDKYDLETLKSWINWKIVSSYVSSSIHKCYDIHFKFYKEKLSGIKSARPIEERAVLFTKGYLGDEFSKIYVDNHADPKLSTDFPLFVKKLRSSVKSKLLNSDWMEEKTKVKAIEKLDGMVLKVVGSSKYEDYSIFNKEYNSVFEFINSYYKWDWDELEVNRKMYKLHDPDTWEMDAVDINAYYHPLYNEIVFPAAILQEPFYSSEYSFGENAGGIGAVIAHEITHGFDDEGSKYDNEGYLHGWWSDIDRKKYEGIISPMENYFNNLSYNDKNLNGRLTQGENLADLGGMKCALDACPDDIEKRKCIYAWAKTWRANLRDEYAEQMIIVDPHSLPKFRINGILPHIEDFYRLFGVTKNDKMFLEKDKRCGLYD